MGLLTILKKVKQEERQLRLLVLGLDNAGKTTVVKRLCGLSIDRIEPTLGFQIQTLDYQLNDTTSDPLQLHLWDIGGQTSIRAYWRNYFEQTDGLVWVVDSSDTMRLELVRQELESLLQQEKLAGATLLVLANKVDLLPSDNGSATDAATTAAEMVTGALKLNELVQYVNRHWKVIPCSAVTGTGLEEGIGWLVEDIQSRLAYC